MKKILFVFLIIFAFSFFNGIHAANSVEDADVGVQWKNSSLQITLEKAQKENKLVLIDFYSPT